MMQTTTVNLGRSFQTWKIMQALEHVAAGTGIGDMIEAARRDSLHWATLVETLRSQGLDDEAAMVEVIGQQAWELILKYRY
jgi:hypothetical protein